MKEADNIQDVLDQLAVLAPAGKEGPRPAGIALAHLKQHHDTQQQNQFLWRFMFMFKRKSLLISGLALLMVVALFMSPAVRAAASDFLGLFRVQKFAPISISPRQMAVLQRITEQGLYPGEIVMAQEPGQPQAAESVEEAAELAGISVRTVANLEQPSQILVASGGSGQLIINLENARAILSAAEVDPKLLPDSLDGANINITLYASVEQSWADGTTLFQTPSPEVAYPEEVDVTVLGQALLQMLGMNRNEARQLAASIDWTSTLVVPIPQEFATFSEVTVDGVSGLALSSLEGLGSSLIWQKGGMIYLLTNEGNVDDLLDLANSLN